MKRSSVVRVFFAAGTVGRFTKEDLPAQVVSNMRWVYRLLISAGPDYSFGFAAGDSMWFAIGREAPANGAAGNAISCPVNYGQFELLVNDTSVPDLCFGTNWADDGQACVIIEWDDGSPSPEYLRGAP